MVAPIDARASITVDDQPLALQLNFRTIALAEEEKADAVTAFGAGKPTLSGMAALLWAFAQPARPDFTIDEAFAIMMRHGKEAGEAISECFARATKGAEPDGAGSPPKGAAKP